MILEITTRDEDIERSNTARTLHTNDDNRVIIIFKAS